MLDTFPGKIRRQLRMSETLAPGMDTPCWLWTGRQNRNGYGRLRLNGREPVAHRAAWECVIGPVPNGLLLDHLCRVRLCCRPDHLEPVTPLVNTMRGEAVLFKPVGGSVGKAH